MDIRTNSSENDLEGNQDREINPDTVRQTQNKTKVERPIRFGWTREVHKETMAAFYTVLHQQGRNMSCVSIHGEELEGMTSLFTN